MFVGILTVLSSLGRTKISIKSFLNLYFKVTFVERYYEKDILVNEASIKPSAEGFKCPLYRTVQIIG
jgi:hypothetical protein